MTTQADSRRNTYRNKPSLSETNPELAEEFVTPGEGWLVSAMSLKKLEWKCTDCDHQWIARVASRSNGSGCPSCSGYAVTDHNCLSTVNPELAAQLVDPSLGKTVSAGSGKKLEWRCTDCDHQWLAQVNSRSKGRGCPGCSGWTTTPKNCLSTVNPDLAAQLVDPSLGKTVSAGSMKKLEWRCTDCDHQWISSPDNRSKGRGCPACSGHVVTPKNCLSAINPELAAQLVDPSLGETVTVHSNKRLEWKCTDYDHQWITTATHRICGQGCPKCALSKMNKYAAELFETLGLTHKMELKIPACRDKRPLPFDGAIFQADRIVALWEGQGRQHFEAIEYFGGAKAFKKQQHRDQIKRTFCERVGIPLIETSYLVRDEGKEAFMDHLTGQLRVAGIVWNLHRKVIKKNAYQYELFA